MDHLPSKIVFTNDNDTKMSLNSSESFICKDVPLKYNLAFNSDEMQILQLLQISRINETEANRFRAIENEIGIQLISPLELNAVLTELDQVLKNHNFLPIISYKNLQSTKIIHSRADYIHYLLPDLKEITNSSYYWGKIKGYEAEKLLESKPDGTFLLRDSEQNKHLFSVTFRKYGRSLHARIEEHNHRFSFDSHDNGVFTSRTITGLLEHYRDPTFAMCFEPMLTLSLHRNNPFSLQQLCRATIVNNITYDGINELHLPNSLKKYLKAYHYKLCVQVKPLDD